MFYFVFWWKTYVIQKLSFIWVTGIYLLTLKSKFIRLQFIIQSLARVIFLFSFLFSSCRNWNKYLASSLMPVHTHLIWGQSYKNTKKNFNYSILHHLNLDHMIKKLNINWINTQSRKLGFIQCFLKIILFIGLPSEIAEFHK